MTIQIMQQVKNNVLITGTPQHIIKNFKHKGIPVILQQSVALIALLLISPLLLLVFIFIKTESTGSALFSQTRVGENGRHFKMYKFRSMYLKTDPHYQEPDPTQSSREGVCKKYINDPRITKTGQFIRKYSIDEIPQLFNIVRGDMCLVGPRPALSIETYEYDNDVQTRLFTKPGLTGLWQVSGRADTNFEEQLKLDKTYIKQQSFLMDCKIIALTIPAVLSAKGAY
ncbi:sugar transferase [Colwellia sp. 12G3]|uniref:sugar transferase n=1 Tax=Colwellia sp. 12G3 TaxID=2058299 RepID=UPI000C330AF1|nr:sugar transferase [Colwellia sp. 12G3]PKI18164.1 multidrug MFS transporter [Colwellia sp. 12G3]